MNSELTIPQQIESTIDPLTLARPEPNQITEAWPYIRETIEVSLPPVSDPNSRMDIILRYMLEGKMQTWVLRNSSNVPLAILTTSIFWDPLVWVKNLFIYSIYGEGDIPAVAWKKGAEVLREFGRSHDCSRIIAYTNNPAVSRMFRTLGGNTEYTLLTLEI